MAWLHRKEQDQPLVTVMGSWLCVMGVFQKELKSSKRNWLGTSVSVQIFESILSESLWMRANCFWKLRCWQQWVRAKHVALQRFLSDRYCGVVSLVLSRWLENADVLLRSFWCFLQTQGGVGADVACQTQPQDVGVSREYFWTFTSRLLVFYPPLPAATHGGSGGCCPTRCKGAASRQESRQCFSALMAALFPGSKQERIKSHSLECQNRRVQLCYAPRAQLVRTTLFGIVN